jgi:hypothetical protein
LAAVYDSISDFAPVQTILPDLKISAVVLGSLILIIAAAKRFGLYSTFFPFRPTLFRSSVVPNLAVETIFCRVGLSASLRMSIAG